jgi:uncharacterized tellurite resistance protein B-like protein
MIDSLKKLLFGAGAADIAAGAHGDSALHHAAAGLLVEAALLDGDFHAAERARIETLLRERFELDAAQAQDLIATAEAAASERVELHTIARTVRDHFDGDERIRMMEMLWAVVYADGELDDFESNMMRRVAGLLYVDDRASGEARKRVLAQIET